MSDYLRRRLLPVGGAFLWRRAVLTCIQIIAPIAMLTSASTAQSQCITNSSEAFIFSSSLFGQVVVLGSVVIVSLVLLALCIFHYVIQPRVLA